MDDLPCPNATDLPNLLQAIRPATIDDLNAILAIQRQASNQVGFLPAQALAQHIAANHVRVTEHFGAITAYILGRHSLTWGKDLSSITQLAVDLHHRQLGDASRLLALWISEAATLQRVGIQANCLANLPANEFWQRKGFVKICYMSPSNARKQDVICWRLPLTRKLPIWFAHPPKRAGHRALQPTINDRQKRKQ